MHSPISIATEGLVRRSPLSIGTDGRLTVTIEIEGKGGTVKKVFPQPRNRDEEVLLLIKVFLLCRS